MATWHRYTGMVSLLVGLTASICAPAQQPPAAPSAETPGEHQARPSRPIPKGRVFVWDIEGTWISQAYLQQLQATRSPRAAGSRTPPLVIKVQREERSYPIVITDFHNAAMQFLLEVEPNGKPGGYRMVVAPEDGAVSSADVTYIPFRGEKNEQGKFDKLSIADPFFGKRKYLSFVRLPETLEAYINRAVIAGKYQDADGRSYEFTQAGEAVLPDRSFPYEVALDPKAGNCDLLHSHTSRAPEGKERLGFAWKGSDLQLFKTKALKEDRYACEPKPFLVLTPQPNA
jgi:hypothetical protein